MFFYDYYSIVIMLPLFLISLIIQLNLKSTYSRYKRINNSQVVDVEIDKSNIILCGPTGSGKCITSDTIITLCNKKTGEIIKDSITNFINNQLNQSK